MFADYLGKLFITCRSPDKIQLDLKYSELGAKMHADKSVYRSQSNVSGDAEKRDNYLTQIRYFVVGTHLDKNIAY